MAFQYGLGARAGELAKSYTHTYKKYKRKNKLETIKVQTLGLKRSDIVFTDSIIRVNRPNFKQKRRKKIDDVIKHQGFVLNKQEPWLYAIIKDWLDSNNTEFVFTIKRARISMLIDKELKKYDSRYSSHWLRHSRASHIGELTEDPLAVKHLLGHARIDTSMKYVHYTEALVRKRLGQDSFEDVLGRGLDD